APRSPAPAPAPTTTRENDEELRQRMLRALGDLKSEVLDKATKGGRLQAFILSQATAGNAVQKYGGSAVQQWSVYRLQVEQLRDWIDPARLAPVEKLVMEYDARVAATRSGDARQRQDQLGGELRQREQRRQEHDGENEGGIGAVAGVDEVKQSEIARTARAEPEQPARSASSPSSASDLRRRMPAGVTILSYWIGWHRPLVFIARRESLEIVPLSFGAKELGRAIQETRIPPSDTREAPPEALSRL